MSQVRNNNPVTPTKNQEVAGGESLDDMAGEDYGDFDAGFEATFSEDFGGELGVGETGFDGSLPGSLPSGVNTKAADGKPTTNYALRYLPQGAGAQEAGAPTAKSLATGSTLKTPSTQWPQGADALIKNLLAQNTPQAKIQEVFEQQFGIALSDADVLFAQEGPNSENFNSKLLNGNYPKYSSTLNKALSQPYAKNYGQIDWNQQMTDQLLQKSAQDAKKAGSKAKAETQDQQIKISKLLFLIMTGEIGQALRLLAIDQDRQMRTAVKFLTQKLGKVQQERGRILTSMANYQTPHLADPKNERQVARHQEQMTNYSRFMQMSGTHLQDMSASISEITDTIASIKKMADNTKEFAHDMMQSDWQVSSRLARMN